MPANNATKPYVKLAGTLVGIGVALFALERFGLSELRSINGASTHIDGTLLSLMVVVPFALVAVGCAIFMYGKIRRL